MAPRITFSELPRLGSWACARCSTRDTIWSLASLHRARGIAQSYLRKVSEGEDRWKQRADKIQSGEISHVWDVLEERGFVKDVAGYASYEFVLPETG